jgi:23S rRNA (adenine2030-N6)-methyltransferase
MARSLVDALQRDLVERGLRKVLCAELTVEPEAGTLRFVGCGMLIVNPPWQLDVQLADVLPWLWGRLAIDARSGARIEWLVPE